jgi:hypothetical protein
MAVIETGKEQSGSDHAAHGRDQRQRRTPQLTELAVRDFAADLEPRHEEEDRHQRVVDPEMEIALEGPITEAHAERRVPDAQVLVLPGRVRPEQSHARDTQQQHAAGRLDREEALDGSARASHQAPHRGPGARRVERWPGQLGTRLFVQVVAGSFH